MYIADSEACGLDQEDSLAKLSSCEIVTNGGCSMTWHFAFWVQLCIRELGVVSSVDNL